jgi:hypothetical protein
MRERLPIVGEEILHEHGCFRRIRQYIAGWHPDLGVLHFGWSGQETIVERDVISPVQLVSFGLAGGSPHDD